MKLVGGNAERMRGEDLNSLVLLLLLHDKNDEVVQDDVERGTMKQ